jgi:DNA-binding transcriptional MerR regulator
MPNCNGNATPKTEVVWLDDTDSGRAAPAQEQGRVLSIDNVARMFGVSRLTLRYYEFRGLIARRQTLGGVRVYSWADCERLAFIVKCRKAGVMLRQIIAIVRATDDDASPLEFKSGQEQCMALVDLLEQRRKIAADALAELSHVYSLLTIKLLGPHEPESRD